MKTLRRRTDDDGQSFKSNGGMHEIAHEKSRRIGFSLNKELERFAKDSARERGVPLGPLHNCLTGISC